jgi:hypothetical protein
MRDSNGGTWACAILLALSLPAAAGDFEFSAMAGATVPLLSDAGGIVGSAEPDGKTKVSPMVLVGVETPISSFANGPTLVVGGEYGASPGESLDISNPETYRSFSMRAGLSQPLSDKLYFALYVESGFSTRTGTDPAPRDKAPRWVGAGLRFKGHASELTLLLNADQRLSSSADIKAPVAGAPAGVETLAYQPTVSIRGKVPLYEMKDGTLSGGKISLYVSAILGMDWSKRSPNLTGGRHDVVTAGVVMGF